MNNPLTIIIANHLGKRACMIVISNKRIFTKLAGRRDKLPACRGQIYNRRRQANPEQAITIKPSANPSLRWVVVDFAERRAKIGNGGRLRAWGHCR
jgi:hypothetical protein